MAKTLKWTMQEEAIPRDNFGKADLSKLLPGRTEQSIRSKAYKMDLFSDEPAFTTADDVLILTLYPNPATRDLLFCKLLSHSRDSIRKRVTWLKMEKATALRREANAARRLQQAEDANVKKTISIPQYQHGGNEEIQRQIDALRKKITGMSPFDPEFRETVSLMNALEVRLRSFLRPGPAPQNSTIES